MSPDSWGARPASGISMAPPHATCQAASAGAARSLRAVRLETTARSGRPGSRRSRALLGPHRLENGIELRKDLHALFDAGYVTVTPSLELRVSRRIREEFENGRDYYALEGSSVRLPLPPAPPPSAEHLEWHGDTAFRG